MRPARGTRRRCRARSIALLALVAVTVSGCAANAGSPAPATGCGDLPSQSGVGADAVQATLTVKPSTVNPAHAIVAEMSLTGTSGDTPLIVETQPTAELFFVDGDRHIVGSGNFAQLAIEVPPVERTLGRHAIQVEAFGEAFRCIDLNDAGARADQPLAPGHHLVAAVLRTPTGALVTPPVPVEVASG